MEFIVKAMSKENTYSVFSRDDFLKILAILGIPPILPDEEGVEYHVAFKFRGKTQDLNVYVCESYWSVPYFTGEDYNEYEVVGYEISISHE
ncbi:hypothetical protein TVAG_129280 [Trichomonas vaginalis G3]|uniref:Uncharacterized protein n=1 Tax=Trichomonas vaginalis (strain ATCC PRA-98 / G3) TaxID=412133 RepID=A2GBA4_TRIV3|nr:hypothetical protein TVAGG3_1058430 [Trichomonas vaginalis G3]EAX85563.1 hypothetical protein TVAG_129280 [Trichomonas vaginalis G3]KAI5494575.1 hypothetical protein TVAGG3_1058430 [Trichomonas vaginalis G3]|eukprot:XP_001298493.1 hypothetical protein [Trichomonas vaginalis G3]